MSSLGLLSVLLFAPAGQTAPPVAAAGSYDAAVDTAVRRGRMLYAYDRAAWLGTDDALAKLKAAQRLDELQREGGSWIVEGETAAPRLTFFANWDRPRAIYTAEFGAGGTRLLSSRLIEVADSALSPGQLRLIAALKAGRAGAGAQKLGFCSTSVPNSVLLPPDRAEDDTIVYLLTPQAKAGTWPLGGHYAVPVAADGVVKPARRFMNSCMDMTAPKSKAAKDAFFVVTHLLNPTPTELHVFTALASGVPLLVVTAENGLMWQVAPTATGPCIVNLGPIDKKRNT